MDAVWLTPFYPSPLADGGYDVSDYCAVDPLLGTRADFDALVSEAAAHRIRVIIDLVPNHCSSAHPWFQAALAAAPGSDERARFIFREGRGPGGEQPPNNWQSQFGGPAWTRVTEADGSPGQWYLHLFDTSQAEVYFAMVGCRPAVGGGSTSVAGQGVSPSAATAAGSAAAGRSGLCVLRSIGWPTRSPGR